jgi:hypothetical protein
MSRIQTSLLLLRNLLDGKETILSHLDPFRHVADGGVFCSEATHVIRKIT